MRIIVTGATGYVGSHLVQRALSRNLQVGVLPRPGDRESHSEIWQGPPEVLYHDASPDALSRALENQKDAVLIHAAALFLPWHRPEQVEELIESNIALTARLLEAAQRAGITRFVNIGTSWENDERGNVRPANLYAATKLAAKSLVSFYAEAYGMCSATLRLFDTYGRRDTRPKLLPEFKRRLLAGEAMDLGDGTQMMNLVYIDDVVDCILLAAEGLYAAEPGNHLEYAVCTGQPASVRSILELAIAISGRDFQANWGARPPNPRQLAAPWPGGERVPGWSPKVSLEEGLTRYVGTPVLS